MPNFIFQTRDDDVITLYYEKDDFYTEYDGMCMDAIKRSKAFFEEEDVYIDSTEFTDKASHKQGFIYAKVVVMLDV